MRHWHACRQGPHAAPTRASASHRVEAHFPSARGVRQATRAGGRWRGSMAEGSSKGAASNGGSRWARRGGGGAAAHTRGNRRSWPSSTRSPNSSPSARRPPASSHLCATRLFLGSGGPAIQAREASGQKLSGQFIWWIGHACGSMTDSPANGESSCCHVGHNVHVRACRRVRSRELECEGCSCG